MIEPLAWSSLILAVFSTAAFLRNLREFHRAHDRLGSDRLSPVSVLIPARDEEVGIHATLTAVLANQGCDFEVLVLDDHSQDATHPIVQQIASQDARVRLIAGQPLPEGWCGKQYACYQLAEHARHDELLFMDADVRLHEDAIRRCLIHRRTSNCDLLSGFPRQIVGTLGEALLIPLIHIVLLTYLPFRLMRTTNRPSASAGCGQLFLTSREAYRRSGGHAVIRWSMHDGVTLPRAYRRAGLQTDLFDASDIAECRMYLGYLQTIRGLMKNAHEGIANARLIVPATVLMMLSFFVPTGLLVYQLFQPASTTVWLLSAAAALVSYVPRVLTAQRFDHAWLSVPLFPLSILTFVMIQWVAFGRRLVGARSSWRGRAYTPTAA